MTPSRLTKVHSTSFRIGELLPCAASRSLTRKARCPTLGFVAWICQPRNVPSLELFVHRLRPASSLDGAGGWAAGSAPSCVDALHLQRLNEADQVALGILELPELDHVRDRLRTHDAGAAEALCLRERLLDVRHRDVDGDVALVPVRPAGDAAADARPVRRLIPLPSHHSVVHRVVGVDLPPEELGVVAPQLVTVLSDHLEVDYRLSHLSLLSV